MSEQTSPIISLYEPTPSVPRRNILRYMGMGNSEPDGALSELVDSTLPEFLASVSCRACYAEIPISVSDGVCDFGAFRVESRDLSRNLAGCDRAILFAATIGMQADIARKRAALISSAKALVLDAMGSACVEALCDSLCTRWRDEYEGLLLRPRYSPGYGDVPLETQTALLSFLDSKRKAGIALGDSLLMTPQKSVSAFVGIGRTGCTTKFHDCADCGKTDCAYRLS